MEETKRVTVTAADLRDAYNFANMGAPREAAAYLCRETGKIHMQPEHDDFEEEDELPDDLEASDGYIALPHKTDLDLGKGLALDFTRELLPGDFEKVAEFFRHKGVYRRFRALLDDDQPAIVAGCHHPKPRMR